MVDSSVGGKTGINLTSAKNIIGAFWQPSIVLIDTGTLDSLPRREYLSGLAEVVKYGVIMSQPFFDRIEALAVPLAKRERDALLEVIAESCRCKAAVVQEDERETTGRRAILNMAIPSLTHLRRRQVMERICMAKQSQLEWRWAGRLAVY